MQSKNLTAHNKIYWHCSSGKCHCSLQTNQFTHIHDLKIFNHPKHNHSPEKSLKEYCFPCIEDQKFTGDEKCINENIHVYCYDPDPYNSDSDQSSFKIVTKNVCRNLDPSNSVKN